MYRTRNKTWEAKRVHLILEPKVHLLSEPVYHPHPIYEIPSHTIPSENIIAVAGKVCYDSYGLDGRPVDEHVRGHGKNKHFSVLEHANFGVFIEGISRACSHEIVRHRHFSYSQRSTRYVDESEAAFVVKPSLGLARIDHLVDDERRKLLKDFADDCEAQLNQYVRYFNSLREWNPNKLSGRELRKWARGEARQLLPHALETRMVMTGNIRSWLEFFEKRTDPLADEEIRRLAELLWHLLKPLAPAAFDMEIDEHEGFIVCRPRGQR